ncbi:MAG: hypothetical protein CVU05_15155 [Bacteroidetes bacterium HGW-Bacteroidetes-21]|nr:MAG: hypothetical protein CVU05_15155 [Bacteroidetes bacterium HGW-Bacteroidetes-21]
MITKSDMQFFRSLHKKEGRVASAKFLVEGEKIITDLLMAGQVPVMLVCTEDWATNSDGLIKGRKIDVRTCRPSDIERCSTLKTPQEVLAVFCIPESKSIHDIQDGLILALDEIQDPGNLGTIIRTAAWFGIDYILCTENCADLYNPKVIQATMGGFNSVQVIYGNLLSMLGEMKKKGFVVTAAVMNGTSSHDFISPSKMVLVMGNESRGVSADIQAITDMRITIPAFPINSLRMESLNVSTATSILCYDLRKKKCEKGR